MSRSARLPAELNPAGFSVADARALGLSSARLRSSDLTTPFRGVRAVGTPVDIHATALAYAARMHPDHFFSHFTAAELLRLRLPDGFRAKSLHVTAPWPGRAPRGVGVIGHQSRLSTSASSGGLRVSSPIATWTGLAAHLSLDDLVAMGDGLVRRKHPLTDVDTLSEAVHSFSGRGCARLTEAMVLVRANTDSQRETKLRLVLVRAGFPEPELNGLILNSHGAEIAHGDVMYRKYRTIVEYDGKQHYSDARQFAIDIARLDELMEEGWRVIRVDNSLMARTATLVRKVETALLQGGWPGYAVSR